MKKRRLPEDRSAEFFRYCFQQVGHRHHIIERRSFADMSRRSTHRHILRAASQSASSSSKLRRKYLPSESKICHFNVGSLQPVNSGARAFMIRDYHKAWQNGIRAGRSRTRIFRAHLSFHPYARREKPPQLRFPRRSSRLFARSRHVSASSDFSVTDRNLAHHANARLLTEALPRERFPFLSLLASSIEEPTWSKPAKNRNFRSFSSSSSIFSSTSFRRSLYAKKRIRKQQFPNPRSPGSASCLRGRASSA